MKELRPVQVILLGFLITIFAGSILLALPIATQSGQATPYIDALFTATTSVCVTGLIVETTMTHWSIFGQAVIILLYRSEDLVSLRSQPECFLCFERGSLLEIEC